MRGSLSAGRKPAVGLAALLSFGLLGVSVPASAFPPPGLEDAEGIPVEAGSEVGEAESAPGLQGGPARARWERAQERRQDVREKVRERRQDVREKVRERRQDVREKVQEHRQDVREKAREHRQHRREHLHGARPGGGHDRSAGRPGAVGRAGGHRGGGGRR